jgi:hypothetical protein
MPHTPDDEFTELVDASIDRVDLVDKAANGLPFLMAKQAADGGPAGLMSPDLVRDLIGKTADPDPQPADNQQEQVTMTGSPAAIAKLIHEAAKRAEAATAPAAEDVAKGALIEEPAGSETDLDPTTILAAPQGEQAPGSPIEPGSPAWEAIDASTARKWTSILARARTAVLVLSEREMLEAASVDPDDAFAAMDLDDAACAIDYAISVLAPFAVDEQAEADCAADAMAAVGKALADFDVQPLDTIEALAQVAKAGRVLSARNEQAIRDAVAALQKVLATLPAPEPDSLEGGLPVAKEETSMQPQTEPSQTAEDVAKEAAAADTDTEDVAKADQAPQIAVYDAKGRLVGIVAPESLIPVESPGDDEGDDAPDEEPEAEPAEGDSPDMPADLDPAPGAEVGVPADEVGKTTTEDAPAPGDVTKTEPTDTDTTDTSDAVLKSSIAEVVKAQLDAHSAAQQEAIAKQAGVLAELAGVVETLKGQVQALEEQPAAPKVFTNGAVPPPQMMRGQDRGAAAQSVDFAKARELKQTLYHGTATEQNQAHEDMQRAAIAALQDIRQGG